MFFQPLIFNHESIVFFEQKDGIQIHKIHTPLKINMDPQNEGLEDDVPFQRAVFQVPS